MKLSCLIIGLVFAEAIAQPTAPVPALNLSRNALDITDAAGSRCFWVGLDRPATLTLRLRNETAQPIVLAAVALGDDEPFVPFKPVPLAAGVATSLSFGVDPTVYHLPCTLPIYFRDQQGRIFSESISLNSKDVITLTPKVLVWRQSQAKESKSSHITNLPARYKLVRLEVGNPNFVAQLVGGDIVVTPLNVDRPASVTVKLITEPENPQPAVLHIVIPRAPASTPMSKLTVLSPSDSPVPSS